MAGFYVRAGRGCDHCETGVPVESIKSRMSLVKLCLEYVMLWFPGRAAVGVLRSGLHSGQRAGRGEGRDRKSATGLATSICYHGLAGFA